MSTVELPGPVWHALPDGASVLVRPIAATDEAELRRAFEKLSAASRFARFLAPIAALTDDMARYLTEVDGTNHFALVALDQTPDMKSEIGVGVARFVRLADEPEVAEAAVTVIDAYQGRGIGRALLGDLVEGARARGVERFRVSVLANNETMLSMLAEARAQLRGVEEGTLHFDVPLRAVGPATDGNREPVRRLLRAAASALGHAADRV